MTDKIKDLKTEDVAHFNVYLANFAHIWNKARTQATISAFLCEYVDIKEKAIYFKAEDGKMYLRSSMFQSQL